MDDTGQLKVLIIGGYGTFGSRLVELLADEPRLQVTVAGRSQAKAQVLCGRLAAAATLVPHALDRDGDMEKALSELAPDILIDATGPFQVYGDDPYRLVRQCIAHGVNYLDFADGSAFARDISAFDAEARAGKVFVLSAASSSPALSAAVVREIAKGMASVEHVEGGIAPSPFAGIGLNVVRAITSYAGKPIKLLRNGQFATGYGLTESRRVTICPPGHLPLGSRRFALVDVPDLELLPEAMPEMKSAWFGAGTAPLSLADFERGFAVKNIVTGTREHADKSDPLYRRILGAAWDQLPWQIRDLHTVETSRNFDGKAQVNRGRGFIARIVGALYRFPSEGSEIPIHVLLERRGDGELWRRDFAGRIFRSWQREGRGRSEYLIDERFGPVSVGLALVTGQGRLEYVVRRWSFLGLPMPMFMAPGGRTFEFVEDLRFHFRVEIAHPWFGLIVRYQGWLEKT